MHLIAEHGHGSELGNYPLGAGFAVMDVETTGVSPRTSRIVELAVVLLDPDLQPVGELCTLIKPDAHMAATEIHGIRARDVRNAPTFAEIAPLLVAGLRGRVPVAHNSAFELRMLTAEFQRLGWHFADGDIPGLCTMTLASAYLTRTPGRSLADCCRATGYQLNGAHTALADARAAAHLLRTYRKAHHAMPASWHDALHAAGIVHWPELPEQAHPRLLTREQAAYEDAVDVPYLARIVAALPRTTGVSAITQSYLAALDRALADRLVTVEEARELKDLAEAMHLGATEILSVHREYLQAVASAALADDIITDAEMTDLQEVARLLALTDQDLQEALTRAASLPRSPMDQAETLALDDAVVITGDTLLMPRQELEQRTRDLGLRLVSAVSGKTKVLVVSDPHTQSGKARKARQLGTRIVGEAVYLQLLQTLEETGGTHPVPGQPDEGASVTALPSHPGTVGADA